MDASFENGRFFCPGEPLLIVSEDERRIIVFLNKARSAAEMGIVIADIFRHFERGRGKEFAASVFAMLYKELTSPTSGHTEIKL